MSDITPSLADWTARGAGALAGSSVSLVYLVPQGRREAVSRFIVGLITGLVFGAATGDKIIELVGLPEGTARIEALLMGATAASFASWWALGLLVRLMEHHGPSRPSGQQLAPDASHSATRPQKDDPQ